MVGQGKLLLPDQRGNHQSAVAVGRSNDAVIVYSIGQYRLVVDKAVCGELRLVLGTKLPAYAEVEVAEVGNCPPGEGVAFVALTPFITKTPVLQRLTVDALRRRNAQCELGSVTTAQH